LLQHRCPPDIAWFVIAVVVNTIKRHAFWPFANVFQKQQEILPSIANFDASAPVSRKAFVGRALTSLFYFSPHSMQRMIGYSPWKPSASMVLS